MASSPSGTSAATREKGEAEEATFGEEQIADHVSKGPVLGQEDARASVVGLLHTLGAAYLFVLALILGLECFWVSSRRSRHYPLRRRLIEERDARAEVGRQHGGGKRRLPCSQVRRSGTNEARIAHVHLSQAAAAVTSA